MGGFGSGRRRGKDITSDMLPLDSRHLQRDGLLAPNRVFVWRWTRNGELGPSIEIRAKADCVILNYRYRSVVGEWRAMGYPIYLEWTDLHYGGRRPWFRCPVQGCGRRVAILYGGAVFVCRHCHDLAYESQRETADNRTFRRAETIRRQLGWKPGIANGEGCKRKGMHWRTFERLRAEHYAWVNAWFMDRRATVLDDDHSILLGSSYKNLRRGKSEPTARQALWDASVAPKMGA